MSVTASAVARGSNPGGAAIIVLKTTGASTFTVTGSGSIHTNGGSIAVNSSDNHAATFTNSGSAYATGVNIVGNYSTSSSGQFVTSPVSNNITTGANATADPLSSLATPSTASLTSQTYTNQTTLQPGYYASGINISASSGTITLNSGIYYTGAGFSITGNANIVGNGVFIYNSSGNLSITGGGNVTLNPMTTGTYAGITLFQSRTNSNQVSITGSGNMSVSGTIYAPDSKLTLTGNGSTVGSRAISNTLAVTGSGNLNMSNSNRGTALLQLVQ